MMVPDIGSACLSVIDIPAVVISIFRTFLSSLLSHSLDGALLQGYLGGLISHQARALHQ